MSSMWKRSPRLSGKPDISVESPSGSDTGQFPTTLRPGSPGLSLMANTEQRLRQSELKIHEHKQTIEKQQRALIDMQEEMKHLQNQFWKTSDQLKEAEREADQLRGHIGNTNEEIQSLRWQLQAESMKRNEIAQELATKSSAIQTLSSHNQKLQKRVVNLENIIAVTSREANVDLQSFFNHYHELKGLNDKMSSKLNDEKELSSNLQETIQTRELENASLNTIIDELQKEMSTLKMCQPKTLRSLLTLRLTEQSLMAQEAESIESAANQVQNWLPSGLSENSLDKICSPNEIQSFANLLPRGPASRQFYEHLRLDVCSMCSKAKFNLRADAGQNFNSMKWLNEYLRKSRFFACCYERVCKECFKKHVIDTLKTKWWYKLGTLQWFPCPRDECPEALGIRCEGDLEGCLRQICDTEVEEHTKIYIKVATFRQVLETITPKPSDEVLKRSAELHNQLVIANRMYSLFDPRFDPVMVDENGCIAEFNAGTIFNSDMDDGPSPVLLFRKFLRRQSKSKMCMVCSKNMFDIDYGDVEAWKLACGNFRGSWMWDVLNFPTSENQECDHDFDVCRVCIAQHLRGTLSSGGPSACDNLSCPQCSKKFGHHEIRKLADVETFAKYDKFQVLAMLSKEPNFRWCLSPLCENGQTYQRSPVNPKISCESCDFEMCFAHESPWHDGLTCDEYDSVRDHGDPNFAETQQWIRTNTKPCPGCQVGIQKGEACFHMTCSQCSHEFCWQCLANWVDIRAQGQQGHAEGCFFRTNDVRPTGLRGENLEDALRARNG